MISSCLLIKIIFSPHFVIFDRAELTLQSGRRYQGFKSACLRKNINRARYIASIQTAGHSFKFRVIPQLIAIQSITKGTLTGKCQCQQEELQPPTQSEKTIFDKLHRVSSFLNPEMTHWNVFSFVFWGTNSISESPLMCEVSTPEQGGASGSSGSSLGSSVTACKKVTLPNTTLFSRLNLNASLV